MGQNKKASGASELRRQAEKRLAQNTKRLHSPRTEMTLQRLVHELEVHQIELEMQNAELRRAQEELESSHNMFVELYDFAPVGYFTIDAQGLIEGVNLTGAQLLGVERSLLINTAFVNFIADADGMRIYSAHREDVLQKQDAQVCEIRLKSKGGTEFHARLQSRSRGDIDGKAGSIWTTVVDVEAHKEAEAKIAHLASFPTLNPNPVIETDLQGKILYRNAATVDIFASLNIPEEVHLFVPGDLSAMTKNLKQGIDQVRFFREVDMSGRTFAEEVVCSATLKCVRIYAWDITERRRAEEALQNSQAALEDLVEERTARLKTALSELKKLKDRIEAENIYFREEIGSRGRYDNIIGQSDGLKYVLYRAEQVAPSNTTVLILGETGTGKELIAAAIHHLSSRKDRPLITVNCAALPGNLIESELFGREKGAFTGADTRRIGRFEIAHGSTLCLDEIGELPLEAQAKLLRVVQHSEFERLGSSHTLKVDVRIIATTNRDLEEEVRKGRFRSDLFYRLNVFPITVPPLRQRKEDIPLLVRSFMDRYAKKLGKQITSIKQETMEELQEYPWPGNVRELESIIERAIILCPGPVLQLTDRLVGTSPSLAPATRTLEETERQQILQILSETRWRIEGKNGAASILGINPSTLRARMHKLGIVRPKARELQ